MNASESENYFKATCRCGINVEVPNELYDQSINCPECGQSFLARPNEKIEHPRRYPNFAMSPQPKPKGISPIFWFAVSGLMVCAALYWLFSKFGGNVLIAGGSAVYAALLILAVVVCLLWILFPVFVYFGLQRMEKILKQIEANTRK